METILITGLETVAGAHLAVRLADRYRVFGLGSREVVRIDGCESAVGDGCDPDSARRWAAEIAPDWIVSCGAAARSAWTGEIGLSELRASRNETRNWARAAEACGARFAVISSDAVFSGPWMFHEEDGACFCPSEEADAVRAIETDAAECCPQTLVVRTNTFGWSPEGAEVGWLERALARLEVGDGGGFDAAAHATPIAAAHLAEILERAFLENLCGTYHVAGAERVSPARFVRRLAEAFDLPVPCTIGREAARERAVGFGRGETSLQTRRIRKALCVAMPTLSEGLVRLREECRAGHAEKLHAGMNVRERVA